MKEVFSFLKWQWQKWQLWQRVYITAMSCFLIAMLLPEPYSRYAVAIPIAILFGMIGKWWIWDNIKESWSKYKQEKKELFNVIKGD